MPMAEWAVRARTPMTYRRYMQQTHQEFRRLTSPRQTLKTCQAQLYNKMNPLNLNVSDRPSFKMYSLGLLSMAW